MYAANVKPGLELSLCNGIADENISNGDGVYAWLNGESESRPNLVALGGPLGEIDEYA